VRERPFGVASALCTIAETAERFVSFAVDEGAGRIRDAQSWDAHDPLLFCSATSARDDELPGLPTASVGRRVTAEAASHARGGPDNAAMIAGATDLP